MTPKFKVGDICVFESIIDKRKDYIQIIRIDNNEYIYKVLNTTKSYVGLKTNVSFEAFEIETYQWKETRLITDEEKLELL